MKEDAGQRAESAQKVLDSLKGLQLLFDVQRMQRGDCTVAVEIERKAKSGDGHSSWILADLYRTGLCIQTSKQEMARWLQKAADQGHINATFELGLAYQSGDGVGVDLQNAEKLFRVAAEHGNSSAAYSLGEMYKDGNGVPQDLRLALSWFEKSLDLGNQKAAVILALLHLRGDIAGQIDPISALRYARPAADDGNSIAQWVAAVALEALALEAGADNNRTVFIEAHKWSNLASTAAQEKISEGAKEIRSRLEELMTPAEISQAQQAASSWNPGSLIPPKPRRKPWTIARIDTTTADDLSESDARAKLRELGVPITKQTFQDAVATDNLGLVKLFHRAGASLDTKIGLDGYPPIYIAADWGSRNVFDYLIASGANVNAVAENSGMTALVRAIGHKRPYMIDKLLEVGAIVSPDPRYSSDGVGIFAGNSALLYAIMDNDLELVRRLFDHGASIHETYKLGDTPLLAAVDESPEMVSEILSRGADPNAVDDLGRTPLHHAMERGTFDIEIVKRLLESGADPTGGDYELPPIYGALWTGHSDAIKLFLEFGVDPNVRFYIPRQNIPIIAENALRQILMNGGTPLMVSAQLGHAAATSVLLENGSDPAIEIVVGNETLSAVHIAKREGHTLVLEMLK